MKVGELKKGMILTCKDPKNCFAIYGQKDKWVLVRSQPRVWNSRHVKICQDQVMIYLGTKKDLDIDMKWTDRFVLINNQVVGVDPASWKRIKPVQ